MANESKHLLVFGVPKINLSAEVKREFNKIGPVASISAVTNEIARKGLTWVRVEAAAKL